MRIGIEGIGVVGARVARDLCGFPEVSSVVLLSGSESRRETLAGAFGAKIARAVEPGGDLDVVVVCVPEAEQCDVARRHVAEGRHVVTTADGLEAVGRLLDLDAVAGASGRSLVVGAGFHPGLSTLLAVHAATLFDEVIEVHTASIGAAGLACTQRRAEALRGEGREWRDGTWHDARAGSSKELLWFPDPMGSHDCWRGDLADPVLIHRVLPTATRITARAADQPRPAVRRVREAIGRGPERFDAVGALRVEVRGRRLGATDSVIYGVMDHPSVACAAVAATAAVAVGRPEAIRGAIGLAEAVDSRVALSELAHRGVRACVFEGSAASA